MKDASDYLIEGKVELFAKCMAGAKEYSPEKVENGADVDLQSLLTPNEKGVYIDFLPETMKRLQGVRGGEATLIMAPPGVGKTTFGRGIINNLLSKGDGKTFGIILEENSKKTRQGVIAYHAGVHLNRFRANPDIANKEKTEEAYADLLPNLELYNTRTIMNNDDLFNKINYFVKVKGCKYGVVDPVGYVVSGRDNAESERRELDKLLIQLAKIVEDLGIHLFLIAHVKRTNDRPPKDREGNIKYPYWERIYLDDARGSGAYEMTMWNIWGLEPERVDPSSAEGGRGRLRVNILKNREHGWLGVSDELIMLDNGRMGPLDRSY